MNHALDAKIAGEIRSFSLRFTCEACAHVSDRGACSLGYPNAEHTRDESLDAELRAPTGVRSITFCKEFELA